MSHYRFPAKVLATASLLASLMFVLLSHGPAQAETGSMAQLQAQLQAAIDASGFDVTVAVTDLQTGESISVRGDDNRLSACSINLFVLIQATLDMEAGLIPIEVGNDLIERTIYSSNANTARELLFWIGGGDLFAGMQRVNETVKRIGSPIFYDHPPAFLHETLAGSENIITANNMNAVLSALWHGQIMSPTWRDYLLEKLTDVKPGLQYLIPAGVGNATVSHKNGFVWTQFGWIDNDVGIVTFEAGGQTHAYAISYLASWVPDEFGDIYIGQQVSRLTWAYFQSAYGVY